MVRAEYRRNAGDARVRRLLDERREVADVEAAIAGLPAGWTAIDVLVNNAGLSRGLETVHEGEPTDWEEMIDTNVKGLLYVSRSVIPGMVSRGRGHARRFDHGWPRFDHQQQ